MRAIAQSIGLGGLDEAIEAFQNLVGDLALESLDQDVLMIHNGVLNH